MNSIRKRAVIWDKWPDLTVKKLEEKLKAVSFLGGSKRVIGNYSQLHSVNKHSASSTLATQFTLLSKMLFLKAAELCCSTYYSYAVICAKNSSSHC